MVVVVWPLPNITVVSAPVERGRLWFSTVLWRRRIASAPLSKRAEVAALAALNEDGADAASQEVLSRLSFEIPLFVSSSTSLSTYIETYLRLTVYDIKSYSKMEDQSDERANLKDLPLSTSGTTSKRARRSTPSLLSNSSSL